MSKRPNKDEAQVTLAHGAFLGDGDDRTFYAPGTQVTIDKDLAATLTAGGYVVVDPDEVTADAPAGA